MRGCFEYLAEHGCGAQIHAYRILAFQLSREEATGLARGQPFLSRLCSDLRTIS